MAEAPSPQPGKSPPLTRAQMGTILVLCALLLAAIVGRQIKDHYGGPRLEQVLSSADQPLYRVDLNTADAAELTILPGIGPSRASRIVAYRAEHGPFASVDDLKNIPGMGDKMIADLRPYATVVLDTDAAR